MHTTTFGPSVTALAPDESNPVAPAGQLSDDEIRAQLAARRFDPSRPPAAPAPIHDSAGTFRVSILKAPSGPELQDSRGSSDAVLNQLAEWYAAAAKAHCLPLTFEEFRAKQEKDPNAPDVVEALACVHEHVKKAKAGYIIRYLEALDGAEGNKIDLENPPEKPVPRFCIGGVPVCTPGNIAALVAQAKTGKTAIVGAFKAAAVCADNGATDRDTLGVSSSPPEGKSLIHLDTEQSRYDAYSNLVRDLRRAGVDKAPAWLKSYSFAGHGPGKLRELVQALLWQASVEGGVHAVIIDGVADMVADVNDAEECNDLVAELHALAIRYDCPIIVVVHENPGADSGKARGHLGSQIERKAESNLRLRKSEMVTTLFSEKQRGAPILESSGPRFAWSHEAGMHVSVESAGAARATVKHEKLRALAEDLFAHLGKQSARYTDLVNAIKETAKIKDSAAQERVTEMKRAGVISKASVTGFWSINPGTP